MQEVSKSGGTFPDHQPMLTFEFTLGPLRIHFSLGDAPSNEPPLTEYVPAAQVERADTVLTDPVPRGEPADRIGFRA